MFCGSNAGRHASYRQAANALGTTLAERGISIVYGGADVGLMGEVADAAAAAGGDVIGVITPDLARRVGHRNSPPTPRADIRLEQVRTMHQRKQRFADLADAYIALPGGLGTLEELFEAATWNQLGIHAKPLGLLNVDGYFDGLLSFLRHAEGQQFIRRPHVDAIVAAGEIETLLVEMQRWRSPHLDKWIP